MIVMFNLFPPNIALLPIAVRGLSESLNAMKRLKVCVSFIFFYITAKFVVFPRI